MRAARRLVPPFYSFLFPCKASQHRVHGRNKWTRSPLFREKYFLPPLRHLTSSSQSAGQLFTLLWASLFLACFSHTVHDAIRYTLDQRMDLWKSASLSHSHRRALCKDDKYVCIITWWLLNVSLCLSVHPVNRVNHFSMVHSDTADHLRKLSGWPASLLFPLCDLFLPCDQFTGCHMMPWSLGG